MKSRVDPSTGVLVAIFGGVAGVALQIWMFSLSDGRGLPIPFSLPELITDGLTVAVLLALLMIAILSPREAVYESVFSSFFPGALGCVIAAAGLAFLQLKSPGFRGDPLDKVACVLGWAAIFCLCCMSVYRLLGKKPFFLIPCIITLYFLVCLIVQYRQWSAVPQLQNYIYSLLALLTITLSAFHRAALTVDGSGFRTYLFFSRASLYFSCLALVSVGGSMYLFYLTMAVWLLADAPWIREVA